MFLDVKLPLLVSPPPCVAPPSVAPPRDAPPTVATPTVAPPSRVSRAHVRAYPTVISADVGFLAATCGDRISFKALVSSTEPTKPISRVNRD